MIPLSDSSRPAPPDWRFIDIELLIDLTRQSCDPLAPAKWWCTLWSHDKSHQLKLVSTPPKPMVLRWEKLNLCWLIMKNTQFDFPLRDQSSPKSTSAHLTYMQDWWDVNNPTPSLSQWFMYTVLKAKMQNRRVHNVGNSKTLWQRAWLCLNTTSTYPWTKQKEGCKS